MSRGTTGLVISVALLLAGITGCSREEVRLEDQLPAVPEIDSPWNGVVVTGSRVNVRAGPGTEYEVLGVVDAGDTLMVTGGLDEWYRVYLRRMSLFAWIYGPLTTGTELPR